MKAGRDKLRDVAFVTLVLDVTLVTLVLDVTLVSNISDVSLVFLLKAVWCRLFERVTSKQVMLIA